MSVEPRGDVWRVRWRENGQNRSRTFVARADAETFDAERARARRGVYATDDGQPCIPLGRERAVALVDAADVEALAAFSWRRNGNGYVVRSLTRDTTEAIHRQIMGLAPDDPREVDHINRNKLDNRRGNLRVVTGLDNQHNREAARVEQIPSGKWRGRCQVAGQTIRTPARASRETAETEIAALRLAAQIRAGISLVPTEYPRPS